MDIPEIDELNTWAVAERLIQAAPELSLTEAIVQVTHQPIGKINDRPYVPALAIPFSSKQTFEMPADHLEALEKAMASVTTILSVGWRAADTTFLDMVRDRCSALRVVASVANTGSHAILKRFEDRGIHVEMIAFDGGFSDFVIRRKLQNVPI